MTPECGQTRYGECLDTVNEFIADESTEPAGDSVVTESQSTGSSARLAANLSSKHCTNPANSFAIIIPTHRSTRFNVVTTTTKKAVITDHRLLRYCHLGSYSKHPKSSPVRPLASNCY